MVYGFIVMPFMVWSKDGNPHQSVHYDASGALLERYDWDQKLSFNDTGELKNAECLSTAIEKF